MRIRHAVALALLLAPLGAMPQEQGQVAMTSWKTIEPGGETSCATGTPYAFHVRPGEGADAAKLLIFLSDGGTCWTGEQCDPSSAGLHSIRASSAKRTALAERIHGSPRTL